MKAKKQDDEDYIISYLVLRQLIGILGILMPFALIFGNKLLGNEYWLQPSISHYYYSYLHIVFVGVLCVLGGFLVTYKGKSRLENRTSNFAGAFAFCVAIFPTEFIDFMGQQYLNPTIWHQWFKWIHFGSAGLLFACFALFCFKIFQESDEELSPSEFDEKKLLRNKIYTFCGWGIVGSIVMIAIGFVWEMKFGANTFTTYSTFIFETTGLLFFGNSWLLKGSLNWKKTDNIILKKMASPVR